MSATLGSFTFDRWEGEPPPLSKPSVELQYRTGVAIPAARVLPAQSTEGTFIGVVYVSVANRLIVSQGYRSIVGTIQALTYGGDSWGNFLVQDVTLLELQNLIHASGINNGTPFSYTPAIKITSRWNLVSRA